MHDWSKLLPSEFFPYASNFYGGDYAHKYFEVKQRVDVAWLYHQRRNKHHWDYWVNSEGVALPMPAKYVKQMVCDWNAMGKVFGDTAKEFYHQKKDSMRLHSSTIEIIEQEILMLVKNARMPAHQDGCSEKGGDAHANGPI